MNAAKILQKLYHSEINFRIHTFWDAGFEVELGDPLNGIKWTGNGDNLILAVNKLAQAAIEFYPHSEFAANWRGKTSHGSDKE